MPILSMFYGIVVRMYFFDDKQHHLPHVHAEYSGEEAVFAITTGDVITGELPSSKTRLVQAWIEIPRRTHGRLAIGGQRRRGFQDRTIEVGERMNPHVTSVRALDDYRLELSFDNGESRIFDVKPYLGRGVFVRLRDPSLFQAVRAVAGSVEWPCGLDLSYDTLYLESEPVTQSGGNAHEDSAA